MRSSIVRRPDGVHSMMRGGPRLLVLLIALGLFLGAAHAESADAFTIDCNVPGIGCISGFGYNGTSTWGYPVDGQGNNCTNYAAFRLAHNGAGNPGNLGNAGSWGANARAKGFAVDDNPAVGSIAWFNYGHRWAPGSGHVAYVEAVNGSEISLSDSNWQGGSKRWRVRRGEWPWPSGFIHIHDVAVPPPIGEGTFVSVAETGRVYRIAGGAPLYVSTWNAFGGAQPTVTISAAQLAAMRNVPADGTFISSRQTGRVFVIAGGAPLYVSAWAAIGGAPSSVIAVDQWAIDQAGKDPNAHLNPTPSDGSFISSYATGRVFKMAGGAPIYVSAWPAIGGAPPSVVRVDQWAIDQAGKDPNAHLNPVPADGSFISSGATGRVFRIAGGAPIYVSTWDAVGGPQAATQIDQWAIDQAGSDPNAHLNRLPADGTFIHSMQTQRVYRIAGGAPLYVSSFDLYGGGVPYVDIDQWALDQAGKDPNAHLNAWPADGTFINTLPDGKVYRFAGGAAFYVSNWNLFGGEQPSTAIDKWNIDQAGANPVSPIRPVAVDGTLLKGLPSGRGWRIAGGRKTPADLSSASVAVDDLAIAGIPDPPAPTPTGGGQTPQQATGGLSSCTKARAAVTRDKRRIRELKRVVKHARAGRPRRSAARTLAKAKKKLRSDQAKVRRTCSG